MLQKFPKPDWAVTYIPHGINEKHFYPIKNEKERFGPDFDVAAIRDEDDDIIATMNAGSIVFFMSDVLHASGKNMSDETRRAWMPQYSLGLPTEHEAVSYTHLTLPTNREV